MLHRPQPGAAELVQRVDHVGHRQLRHLRDQVERGVITVDRERLCDTSCRAGQDGELRGQGACDVAGRLLDQVRVEFAGRADQFAERGVRQAAEQAQTLVSESASQSGLWGGSEKRDL